MQFVKNGFSSQLKVRQSVWEESFRHRPVHDLNDYDKYRRLIRKDPVQALLADCAELYPYSSAAGEMRMDPVPEWLNPLAFESVLNDADGADFHAGQALAPRNGEKRRLGVFGVTQKKPSLLLSTDKPKRIA
jgi:hypothetical protein